VYFPYYYIFLGRNLLYELKKFKYGSHATVVEIFGWDQRKFKELQTDFTGCMLAEMLSMSTYVARITWWFFWFRLLKIFI